MLRLKIYNGALCRLLNKLPSLWAGVAGDRPVANKHDDPGHITWRWKDSILGQRKWYYAKVLRRKATMISLKVAPYFYSLTENFGHSNWQCVVQLQKPLATHTSSFGDIERVISRSAADSESIRCGRRAAVHVDRSRAAGRDVKDIVTPPLETFTVVGKSAPDESTLKVLLPVPPVRLTVSILA